MTKKKTSLDPKKCFAKSKVKVRKDAEILDHDPDKNLLDEDFIARAFWAYLRDEDSEGAMGVIIKYIEMKDKVKLSEETGLSRQTIYNSLTGKNPKITTLAKLIHAI